MHLNFVVLISLPILVSAWPARKYGDNSWAVNTSSGNFAPFFEPSYPNVAAFLDIPFAETPVGDLRFTPPVAKKHPGDKIVQATKLPRGCIQYVPLLLRGTVADSLISAANFQRGDYANTTEDCLRLSLFAPKNAIAAKNGAKAERLPVVIWVHGGGYMIGGTNVPYQLAQPWVQRSQKHIVVQIQYRLNLLGLPNAAGFAKEGRNLNLALLDQRLAVEWVRDNIARFGGDPNRITLWGESAGAYATDGYLFAWPRDPIVKGVIADSGNALAIEGSLGDARNHSTFSIAAKHLCCGGLSPEKELQCMRGVPEHKLKEYLQAELGQGGAADDGLGFSLIPDNVTAFTNYTERITTGSYNFPAKVPLLIGTNTNEGAAVIPYNFPGYETATEIPANLKPIADGFGLNLQCTTLKENRLRSEAGARTFQYLYAGNFTNISPLSWLGAYHTAELPLIFGTHDIEGPSTKFEQKVSERMQDLYLKFASDPAHGLEKDRWPAAQAQSGRSKLVKWAGNGKVEEIVDAKKLTDECTRKGFAV
ncbi:Alpha/Beta hydrolase protein [Fusarium redolens]|uniref:Carboxylic ester hydrolase n=1 Tax=Fusarium redolens TaxID=48865 RepID=A0A9P9K1C2_FUSRE|nr:Alpha/Beta hydrolase protein [Fusarium redolens]KAH7236714.1 Alpha/Beta hydrolase protein [Fusarium redolens]